MNTIAIAGSFFTPNPFRLAMSLCNFYKHSVRSEVNSHCGDWATLYATAGFINIEQWALIL